MHFLRTEMLKYSKILCRIRIRAPNLLLILYFKLILQKKSYFLLVTALQDCHSFTVPWASQENHARPQAFQKSILPSGLRSAVLHSVPRAELICSCLRAGMIFLGRPRHCKWMSHWCETSPSIPLTDCLKLKLKSMCPLSTFHTLNFKMEQGANFTQPGPEW